MSTPSTRRRTLGMPPRYFSGAWFGASLATSVAFILMRVIGGEGVTAEIGTIASVLLFGLMGGMLVHFPALLVTILVLILIRRFFPALLPKALPLTMILAFAAAAGSVIITAVAIALFLSPDEYLSGASVSSYLLASTAIGGVVGGSVIARSADSR